MVENVLRLQLRDETSGVHEALHRHPEFIALQAGQLDTFGQYALMSRIGAFYAALDPKMTRAAHLAEDIGYAYRPRSPLFPEVSPRSVSLPQIDTLPAFVGAAYVVDGAVLGGRMIAGKQAAHVRHAYWDWCIRNGPTVWRRTLALIAGANLSDPERQEAIGTAHSVFEAFAVALDQATTEPA
ncbi:MAG: biliverdin-producing heme oxygenase [Pseudomonadota bacterium]